MTARGGRAQVLGERGVDKRVDIFAAAITGIMSVFELENLDLAYSPPFGSANDPVNIAGFVAGHIAHGDIATVASETWQPNGDFLLDVRDEDEVADFGKLKPDAYGKFSSENFVVGAKTKTGTERLHHIDQTEPTIWVLIAILLLATLAAGYMFWLKTGF